MTLLRRRPREVYRVYSEEEYLDGAGAELGGVGVWPGGESQLGDFELGELPLGESPELGEFPLGQFPLGEWPLGIEPVSDRATQAQSPETGSVGVPIGELYDGFAGPRSRPVRERRLRRVAGVAALVGAIGTVGALVVLNLTRANGDGGGRRGSLAAATRSSRVARSPALDDPQPQVISSRPALVRPVETARSRVPRIGRPGLRGPAPRRSGHIHSNPLPHRRADVAVVVDYVPRPSSGAASPPPVPAQVSATPAPPAPAPPQPAPAKRPEFGFER